MTIVRNARGSYAKTAARRQEILEAGFEVFATSGYRSGSIREVAERVGMSQAGLLHHFSSKSELLAAVLEFRDEKSRELVHIDEHRDIEYLRGLMQLVEFNAGVPGLVELHCILSAEATSPEHPAHEYFVRRYEWVVGLTRESFEEMKRRGQLKAEIDPASAARSIVALIDGLQVQWLLNRDLIDMAEECRHYLRSLMTVDL